MALAAELAHGPTSKLPAVRTWAAATSIDHVALSASGPSRLAVARSQEAQRFLDSTADVWVTCDDDAYVGAEGLRAMVSAVRTTGGLVSAPCLQRDTARTASDPGTCNVRFPPRPPEVLTGDGYQLAHIHATGMGVVAMHRDMVAAMAVAYARELAVQDEASGKAFTALFFERISDDTPRRWQGEDMSFCFRVRESGHPMHAIMGVEVVHAGRRMVLELDGTELAMRVFDLA